VRLNILLQNRINMAISHKKKRKLIHNEKLYLWNIKEDEDSYLKFYLDIVSEDRSVYLSYEINQTSDHFRYPKISVGQSDKMPTGMYCFFPPMADEFISTYHVRKILNWHDSQDGSLVPIKFKMPDNPFENIDFKNGLISYIETDFSNKKEDMLQVAYPSGYLLDVGWYGVSNGYVIRIIKNQDWEHPVEESGKSIYELHEAIICAIEMIEKLIESKQ